MQAPKLPPRRVVCLTLVRVLEGKVLAGAADGLARRAAGVAHGTAAAWSTKVEAAQPAARRYGMM